MCDTQHTFGSTRNRRSSDSKKSRPSWGSRAGQIPPWRTHNLNHPTPRPKRGARKSVWSNKNLSGKILAYFASLDQSVTAYTEKTPWISAAGGRAAPLSALIHTHIPGAQSGEGSMQEKDQRHLRVS